MVAQERVDRALPGSFLGRFFLGHFRAGFSGFGEADGDGLFAAGYFLAGAATFEGAVLALVHGALDLRLCFLAVLCHGCSWLCVDHWQLWSRFRNGGALELSYQPALGRVVAGRVVEEVGRFCSNSGLPNSCTIRSKPGVI